MLSQLQEKDIIVNFSFAREKRLRKSSEFRKVQQAGNRLFSTSLLIYHLENNLSHPRLGLVVSKKVSPNAVIRNQVKRRLREIFRLHQHQIAAIDLVVIAKQVAKDSSYQQLEGNFLKALSYAGKIK